MRLSVTLIPTLPVLFILKLVYTVAATLWSNVEEN